MISFMMYATRNTKGTRVQSTLLVLFRISSNVVDTTAIKLFKPKELFLPGGDKYKLACFAC